MTKCYLVKTQATHGRDVQYSTVEGALRGARGLLGDGAPSVWIVDADGNLILPDDQVRARLNLSPGRPQDAH